MGHKCPIPTLVMAKGTKGLSAQYKKEMSRINRLTYGARKRGYEFDIPYHETRYGLSKLKEITSVKQLYKFSTKLVVTPYSGKIERVSGELAREYERSKSARKGAITKELSRAFEENPYKSDSYYRLVRERAYGKLNLPIKHLKEYDFIGATAKQIVERAITQQNFIDERDKFENSLWYNQYYQEDYGEEEDEEQDSLWHKPEEEDYSSKPKQEQQLFEDEKPDYDTTTDNYFITDEEEIPSVSEDMVERFFGDENFMNKSPYYINKKNALKDKVIDKYGMDKAAELLERAYSVGVVQQMYTAYFRNFDADLEALWDYLGYLDEMDRNDFEEAYNASKEEDEDWQDDDNIPFEDFYG